MLRCWIRRLGLSSHGAEQGVQRAQIVFILDLAHKLLKDVLQRNESQNASVFLANQSHGTVRLEKHLQRHGHVVVGFTKRGK